MYVFGKLSEVKVNNILKDFYGFGQMELPINDLDEYLETIKNFYKVGYFVKFEQADKGIKQKVFNYFGIDFKKWGANSTIDKRFNYENR